MGSFCKVAGSGFGFVWLSRRFWLGFVRQEPQAGLGSFCKLAGCLLSHGKVAGLGTLGLLMESCRNERNWLAATATNVVLLTLFGLSFTSAFAASAVRHLDGSWEGSGNPKCFEAPSPESRTFRQQVPIPASWRNRHLRVVVTATGKVSVLWNGDLAAESRRVFDLETTRFGEPNSLEVRLDCSGVARCGLFETILYATPRVYLESEKWKLEGRKLRVQTDVRNTLDNTVNVDLHWELSRIGAKEVDGGSIVANVIATHASAATVPPLSRQTVETTLELPAGLPLWRLLDPSLYRLRIIMVKNAEAVEGDYDVELESTLPLRSVEVASSVLRLNGDDLRLRPLPLEGNCYPDLASIESKVLEGEALVFHELPLTQALSAHADQLGLWIATPEALATTPQWLVPTGSRSPLSIRDVYQKDGDSFVEVENSEERGENAGTLARYPLRNLQVRLGHREQVIPSLRPGERVTLRFVARLKVDGMVERRW
jgi:hypothetical protein